MGMMQLELRAVTKQLVSWSWNRSYGEKVLPSLALISLVINAALITSGCQDSLPTLKLSENSKEVIEYQFLLFTADSNEGAKLMGGFNSTTYEELFDPRGDRNAQRRPCLFNSPLLSLRPGRF
jgi:hypothetical protein